MRAHENASRKSAPLGIYWAVGEWPALVTVRAKVFGNATEFTRDDDVASFANVLSKKLLAQHYRCSSPFLRGAIT